VAGESLKNKLGEVARIRGQEKRTDP